ncbi:MAG TPA: hypothetical protein VF683_07870 [Chthoniobacterales bacterium]
MEQIFFLVLLAAVGLIRWIVQVAEERKNAEAAKRAAPKEQPNAPIERAPAQSEEERIRRFMEALGVPTTAAPPKAPPREVQPKKPREPKRKVLPVDPFPVPRTRLPERPSPAPPPPVVVLPPPRPIAPPPTFPPAPTVINAPVVTTAQRTAPEFEVADVSYQPEDPSVTGSAAAPAAVVRQDVVAGERAWAARLATPESLRDAIVLREIFGAPRSMQSVD